MTLESDRKKAIKEYMKLMGYEVYPIYNGAVYDIRLRRYRKSGTRPGVADLFCVKPGIRSIWIETKGNGKQTPDQAQFEAFIKGIPYTAYVLARSVSDIEKELTMEA